MGNPSSSHCLPQLYLQKSVVRGQRSPWACTGLGIMVQEEFANKSGLSCVSPPRLGVSRFWYSFRKERSVGRRIDRQTSSGSVPSLFPSSSREAGLRTLFSSLSRTTPFYLHFPLQVQADSIMKTDLPSCSVELVLVLHPSIP